MLYILLPSPMFRSLQLLFRPGAGEHSVSLAALHAFRLAPPASLFGRYLNVDRRPCAALYGHSRPIPL